MREKDNGGPAFPVGKLVHTDRAGNTIDGPGMTLRDYMAAKAMQGQLSYGRCNDMSAKGIAEYAYAYADAMLKIRGN